MTKREIAVFGRKLVDWYIENHRKLPWRESSHPYQIWISEVMLQQTQVNTVIPYYHRFLERFPTLVALAEADQQQVLKRWEGLGYYARARNLHKAARRVVSDFHGEIPTDIKEFRKLPGVGDYIAAAVMSIAFDQPYPVVDGNVKRVLARLLCLDSPVNGTGAHKVFVDEANKLFDPYHPGAFNQAMMELGARICTPAKPNCGACPVSEHCRAVAQQIVNEYPKKQPAKSVPEYHIATGVIYRRDKVLITRRPPEGLLGGLWEFPGGKVLEGETPAEACLREIKEEVNLSVSIRNHLVEVRHAYTHFKIKMDVFECDYVSGRVKLNGPTDFHWVSINQLNRYPFPKANHKFIPLLKKGA